MLPVIARFLLSAALICAACIKLSLESASADRQQAGWTHFYLVAPNTLFSRGTQLLEDGPAQDLKAGQSILKGLVQTNPASADRWSDLGGVFLEAGQLDKGKYCFLRAAQLAPNTAETWLSVANFYIDRQQYRSALPYLGRILESTNKSEIVFNDFDRLKLGIGEIAANGGMPAEPRIAEAYFRHLLEAGDLAKVREAWEWLKPRSPDDRLAEEYIHFLLTRGLTNEASAAWSSQLGAREADFGKSTFVLNGGFEHEPGGPLFDWQISRDEHVQVSRDDSVARSGSSSLRIEFDGKINLTHQGVSQRVFLPRGAYRFEAFVRTAGITTDEGVGFRVLDTRSSNRPMIETERITGTTDWKKLEGTLVVDAPVKLVEIQVVRRQSLRFDSLIAGTAWIDQVSLTPLLSKLSEEGWLRRKAQTGW